MFAPDDATGSCGADGASQMPAVGGSDSAGVTCSIPNREVYGLSSALPPVCDSAERVIKADASAVLVVHTGPDALCVEPGAAGGGTSDSSVSAIPGEAPSWIVTTGPPSSDSSRMPWRGAIMADVSVVSVVHTGPDASCVEPGAAGGGTSDSSVSAIPGEAPSWIVTTGPPSSDSSRVPSRAVSHTVPSSGKGVIKADASAAVVGGTYRL